MKFLTKEELLIRQKRRWILLLSIVTTLVIGSITVSAAGPMDGQVVDGTLLTSVAETSDEQVLVPGGIIEDGVTPYGNYLSRGIAYLGDEGTGLVWMSGETVCYEISEIVRVNLYLDRLVNGSWITHKTDYFTQENTYYAHNGLYMSVPKGYYYRLRGYHSAMKNGKTETTTTCTDGLYID